MKTLPRILLSFACAGMLSTPAMAANVEIQAGIMSGTLYNLSYAFTEIVKQHAPEISITAVETQGTGMGIVKGAAEPATRIVAGTMVPVLEARQGKAPFKRAFTDLKAIGNLTENIQTLITFDPAIKTGDDLAGKKLGCGPKPTVLGHNHASITAAGMKDPKDMKVSYMAWGNLRDAIMDGGIDAMILGVSTRPQPPFSPVAVFGEMVASRGVPTFLDITPEAVAEAIAAKHPKLQMATLVRMADDSKTDVDHERHYEQVAAATRHPVIIQTYNGIGPVPSMQLMIDLAKRHPGVYGWFKVEGSEKAISDRMAELVAAKPVVKTVFTGWGGRDWLYQYRRIGTRGVISQRPMYADLMVRIWRALESGSPEADDLFAKFMYLRNLDNVLPSAQMRGWNLYVLKRRGVFPNTLSRVAKKGGGWSLEDLKLTPGQVAEIDARLKFAGIE